MITVDSAVNLAGAAACGVADVASVLSASHPPDVRISPPNPEVGVAHRRTPDADIYLVINTGPSAAAFTLAPRSERSRYEVWDAHTGEVVRTGRSGGGVDVSLYPYQGTVIVMSDQEATPSDPAPDDGHGQQTRLALRDGWRVQFADRDSSADVVLPHVWEDDPDQLGFSGRATYRATVDLPDLEPSPTVLIDFGDAPVTVVGEAEPEEMRGHSFRADIDPPVGVMAEVRVNDVDCGMVWAPPYAVDVSRAVQPGANRVEITVYNTAANALAHDEHVSSMVAESESRYGRRFRMQELDRAMEGVRSGLLAVPTLVITD